MIDAALNYINHNGLMTFFVCEWIVAFAICGIMMAFGKGLQE